jgi:hypothetical protein
MKAVKLSALRTDRLYHPANILGIQFMSEAESTPKATMRPEGLWRMKNSAMTPPRIESATFWLVAQHLNELHQRVPEVCIVTNGF